MPCERAAVVRVRSTWARSARCSGAVGSSAKRTVGAGAIFSGVGIWLGLKLTKTKVVVREVPVEVLVPAPAEFTRDQKKVESLGLTARELEILEFIAAGLSNKEIADRANVSENTVKTHTSRVFDKLGAERRTQAVQLGKEYRLIP